MYPGTLLIMEMSGGVF